MRRIRIHILILIVIYMAGCDTQQETPSDEIEQQSQDKTVVTNIDISDLDYDFFDYFEFSDGEQSRFGGNNFLWFNDSLKKTRMFLITNSENKIEKIVAYSTHHIQSDTKGILDDYLLDNNNIKKPIFLDIDKTNKGISIGLTKDSIISIIGQPSIEAIGGGSNELTWNFTISSMHAPKTSYLAPIACDSMKFNIHLHFVRDTLVQLEYDYSEP